MKKHVKRWLKGELSDDKLANKLGPDGLRELEERVFQAIARKCAAVPEKRTVQ